MKRIVSVMLFVFCASSAFCSDDPSNPFVPLPLPKHNLERTKRKRAKSMKRLLKLLKECHNYLELKELGVYLSPDLKTRLSA